MRGLVNPSVFVRVMLNVVLVEFTNVQEFPPFAVLLLAGSVNALNPVFVK